MRIFMSCRQCSESVVNRVLFRESDTAKKHNGRLLRKVSNLQQHSIMLQSRKRRKNKKELKYC